jgi:hypothetical protein
MLLWQLYNQAETWGKLPSEILFLTDWIDCYTVNQAVWNFGKALEAALAEAEEKGKTQQGKTARRKLVLDTWLNPKAGPKKYRNPGADPEGMIKRA